MSGCRCQPIIPSPAELFDLSKWEHAVIFDGVDYVWDAIKRLHAYLDILTPRAFPLSRVYNKSAFLGEDNVSDQGAMILPFTTIDAVSGPVFLGRGAKIGPNAYIRGPALISAGCVVGHCSEVKNSIMLPGSHASHRCYVGDSILGNGVNLANDTSLNNWKFNETEIALWIRCKCASEMLCRDIKVSTGMTKFGAVLGDRTKTGSHISLNPGTVVMPEAWIFQISYGPGIYTKGMVRMDRRHL